MHWPAFFDSVKESFDYQTCVCTATSTDNINFIDLNLSKMVHSHKKLNAFILTFLGNNTIEKCFTLIFSL